MSWTRVSAVLPGVLLACAKVATVDEAADAGPAGPTVESVEPQPGAVPADARFVVHFSSAMDEGQLLAATGRSETVVLAAAGQVELAAAAIEHSSLSAYERTLLVAARPELATDRKSIALTPDQPLPAGGFFLLVSPRLKDGDGRKLAAAARYSFQVAPPPAHPRLVSPAAGGDAPANLTVVRAFAASGRLALHAPDGAEVASADAHGEALLSLAAALTPGSKYTLALDGVDDPDQSFTAAACARTSAPALEAGAAALSVRDTAVTAEVALDWPAKVEVQVGDAPGEPCSGQCATAAAYISCGAKACGPQSFDCKLSLHLDGLEPAHDYALRIIAQDDLGHETQGPVQKFTTIAPLPRLVISEVMAAPPSPQGEAEYVELLNQGPGVAVLDTLALVGPDGVPRLLSGTPPPVSVRLAPGARALAAGSAFDPARYPALPPGTPVLRASTQRLLARGLADDAPPAVRLMQEAIELSSFPGGGPKCPSGASLQRDETVPPDGDAAWSCGAVGGTPGAPP